MSQALHWATENWVEIYAAGALLVTLAVWGHDLSYHPLPKLSRAAGIGAMWWMLVPLAVAYPFMVAWRARFPSEELRAYTPLGRAIPERTARINMASRLWAETLRASSPETPERDEALRALDAATKAAMAAVYARPRQPAA